MKSIRVIPYIILSVAVFVAVFSGISFAAEAAVPASNELPVVSDVSGAQVNIDQANNSMTITAQSASSVLNFSSFNIGSNASVNIIMPSSDSRMLNRVTGDSISSIFGSINANQGLWVLVNTNGIYFSPTARINVDNMIASTLDISTNNFLNGNYIFEHQGTSYAQLLNEGKITGNNIALMGSAVENTGIIVARAGSVHLSSGDKTTVSFDRRGLISIEVNENTSGEVMDLNGNKVEDALSNSGSVQGVTVVMTAQTANNIFKNAVNQTGIVKATQVVEEEGVIRIVANNKINLAGTLETVVQEAVEKRKAIIIQSQDFIGISGEFITTGNTALESTGDIIVDSNITTNSGNLDLLADYDLDGVGTFTQAQNTTISTINYGDITIQSSGASTLGNINSAGSLILKQGGLAVTYNQLQDSTITTYGSLTISSGVTLNAANSSYNIGKDWINQGAFNPQTSTVSLTSSQNALVKGNNVFYNFSITEPGKIVKFESESTQAILNNLTFRGEYGNLLTLTSIDPLKQFSINPLGQTDIQYSLISNLNNIRGPPLKALHTSSLGNNTNLDLDPFWTGNGPTSNWSDPDNWDTGTIPTAFDTVTFDGITGTNPNKDSYLDPAFQGSIDNLTLNGYTGTLTLQRDLTISGNLNIQTGSFNTSTYTVTFTDASKPSYISGNITFYNFTCVTPDKELYFQAGKTYTFTNSITLTGAVDQGVEEYYIKLRSQTPGSQYYLNVQSAYSLERVNVSDAYAVTALDIPIGVNAGNNTNITIDPTWDNGAGDNLWSTAVNWDGNAVPTGTDAVTFDGTSTANCTIDNVGSWSGGNITIAAAYTGTINVTAASITINTFSQSGGTFQGGSSTININGNFTLAGGTFTSTSGTLTVSGNWSHTGATSRAIFNHNSGTVDFNGSGTQTFGYGPDSFYTLTHTGSGTLVLSANWPYQRTITIDAVTDTLTAFPVLVYATGLSNIQANGLDIVFTDSTGARLNHEIESYSGGTLWAWVAVNLSTSATTIYMNYGNATCASQSNATGTWDSNFKGVWHMDSTSWVDTTGTSANGSAVAYDGGTAPSITSSGLIGSATTFSAASNTVGGYVTIDDTADTNFASGSYTISAWVKLPGAFTWGQYFVEKYDGDNVAGYHLSSLAGAGANQYKFWVMEHNADSTAAFSIYSDAGDTLDNTSWHLITYVRDTSTNPNPTRYMYFDGQPPATPDTSYVNYNVTNASVPILFGARLAQSAGTYNNFVNGTMDQIEMSNSARSGAWILAQYNNQNAPADFASVGSETTRPLMVRNNFSNTGNLQLRGDETISVTGSTTHNAGSTVTYVGDADAGADTFTINNWAYRNLTFNATDTTNDTFQLGAALDVNGLLTITAGNLDVTTSNYQINVASGWTDTGAGTFVERSGTVVFDGTGTINSNEAFNAVTINASGSTVTLGAALDVNAAFRLQAGTFDCNSQTQNYAGNFQLDNGTTFTKGGAITFDGTTAATYTDSTAGIQNIGAVTIGKTNGTPSNNKLTLATSMKVDTLTINANNTLDLASGGYTLTLANAGATATVFTNNGTLTPGDSTVKYSATNSAGNINVTTTTYDNLQFSGVETYDLAGNLTSGNALTGNLIIDTDSTLDATATNYNLTAVNITINGTYTAQGSTITASGDWNHQNGTFTYGTSEVILNGTSNTLYAPNTYNTRFYKITIGGTGAVITINSTGGFGISNTLTINGSLSVPSGALVTCAKAQTFSMGASSTLTGAGTFRRLAMDATGGATTITTGATINIGTFIWGVGMGTGADATGTVPTNVTYGGDLLIRGSYMYGPPYNVGGGIALLTGTLNVTGNLCIYNDYGNNSNYYSFVTLDAATNNVAINVGGSLAIGDQNITNTNGVTYQGGRLSMGTGTLDVDGSILIFASNANNSNQFTAGTQNINVAGNWTNSDIFTANSSTVTFNGTADQTITTNSQAFNILTLNNTGASGSDDIIISGTLDVNGLLTITNGDLDVSTNDPAVNLADGMTVGANGSIDLTAYAGTWIYENGTLTDNRSTIGNLGSFTIVDYLGGNSTLTLGSNIKATSITVITIEVSLLNLGTGSYTLELTGSGTPLTISAGEFNKGTGSTVKYSGTSATNIATVAYNNLQLSGATTYSLTGNLTGANAMTGNLTIDNGATLDTILANSYGITLAGNWANSGIFTARSGTVTLNGTADQTITTNNRAFNILTLNNTGASGSDDIIISGALNVNGLLTITNGDLDVSTNDPAVNLAGGMTVGANGSIDLTTYSGTWTYDGTGTLSDSSATNLGNFSITATMGSGNVILTLGSSIKATSITIVGFDEQYEIIYDATLNLGAGSYTLELTGSGTPLSFGGPNPEDIPGIFNKGTGSTVKYSGTSATNIATVAYNNLQLSGATTYSLTGNLTGVNAMTGNLTIDSGATLDVRPSSTDYSITAVNITINGTLDAASSSSTITVSGGWDSSLGTFTYGTSTVDLTGTGNLTIQDNGDYASRFYKLNAAAAGKTTTIKSTFGIDNLLTLGTGIFTDVDGSPKSITLRLINATPLLNAGATVAIDRFIYWPSAGGTAETPVTMTVVGGNYGTPTYVELDGESSYVNFNINGTLTANILWIYALNGVSGITVNTQNNTIIANYLTLGANDPSYNSGSATVNLGSSLVDIGTSGLSMQPSGGSYALNLGTATITCAGSWTLSNGTGSITQDSGTSTVTFDGTGTQILTSNIQSFYNLTHSGSGTLRLADNLNLSNGGTLANSNGTFDTETNSKSVIIGSSGATSTLTFSGGTWEGDGGTSANQNITVYGNMTISAGTFKVGSQTITVSGNWDSSTGTFTAGTSTVTFAGSSGIQTVNSGSSNFYDVTINNTGTSVQLTTNNLTQATGGTLTMTAGTLDLNGRTLTLGANLSTSAGTIAIGSGSLTGSSSYNITLATGGTITQGTGTMLCNNYSQTGGTFTGGSGDITLSGTYGLTGGSFTSTSGTLTIPITFTRNAGITFTHNSGTVKFTANGSSNYGITTNNINFNNLSFDKTGGATAIILTLNDSFTVAGNLTAQNNTDTDYSIYGSGTPTVTVSGNINFPATAGSTGGVNYGTYIDPATNNFTTNVAGNYTSSDAQALVNSNITLNGSGTQTITDTTTYNYAQTFKIDKASGTAQLGADLRLNNNLNINTGTLDVTTSNYNITMNGTAWVNNGTFNGRQGTVTFTYDTILSGSGTYNFYNLTINNTYTVTAPSGNINVGGNWDNNGAFTHNSGTVTFNGTTQSIGGSATTTFNNLTTSGSTNTSTGVTTNIAGNLSVGDGTTFTAAGYPLTVTGTTTVGGGASGNLTVSSATGTKTFTGLVTINAGGTWNNSGNSAITFQGGITNSGTFTAGSGVHTFDTNSQALTGTFSIPSVTVTGVTLTNNGTLSVTTALAGTGGLTNSATGTLNLNFTGTPGITTLTATSSGNTVNYGFAGTQTVKPVSYHHLTLSNSGAKTMATVTTIAGDLTISGSATMADNAALTVTGALNYSSSGSTTLTASTPISIGTLNHTAGTLIDNGNTITVTGTGASTWVESATFTPTGTVTFTGASPQIGASNFNNLTINVGGGNTATLAGAATLAGNLNISSGTLDANAKAINVAGNWANSGIFIPNANTVTFDGAGTSILSGDTTFYDLVSATAGKTLTLTAGTTQTVTNSLTLTGTAGNPIIINDTGAGAIPKLTLNSGAIQSINNVNVTNNDASAGLQLVAGGTSSLSGTTTNWVLGSSGTTYTWTGNVSTDWNTPGNWDLGVVPSSTDTVIIPSTANQPALAGAVTLANLTINSGETLSTGNNTLTVTGNLTLNGTLNAGTSTVTVNGNFTAGSNGTIQGTTLGIYVEGFIGTPGNPLNTNVTGTLTLSAESMQDNVSISVAGTGTYVFSGAIPGFIIIDNHYTNLGQSSIRGSLEQGTSNMYMPRFTQPMAMPLVGMSMLPMPMGFGAMPMPLPAAMPAPAIMPIAAPVITPSVPAPQVPAVPLPKPKFEGTTSTSSLPTITTPGEFLGAGAQSTLSRVTTEEAFRGNIAESNLPELLFKGITTSGNLPVPITPSEFRGSSSGSSLPEPLFTGINTSANLVVPVTLKEFKGITVQANLPQPIVPPKFEGITLTSSLPTVTSPEEFIGAGSRTTLPEVATQATFAGNTAQANLPEPLFKGITTSANLVVPVTLKEFKGTTIQTNLPQPIVPPKFEGITPNVKIPTMQPLIIQEIIEGNKIELMFPGGKSLVPTYGKGIPFGVEGPVMETEIRLGGEEKEGR